MTSTLPPVSAAAREVTTRAARKGRPSCRNQNVSLYEEAILLDSCPDCRVFDSAAFLLARSGDPRRKPETAGREPLSMMTTLTMPLRKIAESPIPAFIIKEIAEALPAIVFFAIGFNLIVLTTQLILDDYGAQFAGFMVATMAALLVGKAVLVAKLLPFFRRFDNAPLIQPILFKTIVYWAVVFLARFLEKLVEYLFSGGRIGGIPEYVTTHFTWHRFVAIQIWIFVLFLIYVTADELNTLFGHGELFKIFFTRRSSQLKLTRRQRVRTLVELDRLTEAHEVAQLRDPNTAAHAEMVGLIKALAAQHE